MYIWIAPNLRDNYTNRHLTNPQVQAMEWKNSTLEETSQVIFRYASITVPILEPEIFRNRIYNLKMQM